MLVAIAAIFCVYVALRTNHFNGDGIGQVSSVVDPIPDPRYLLYFPLISLLCWGAAVADPLVFIRRLQYANAALAGLALLALFWLLAEWTRNRGVALAATASVAFSFAFWEHAMDVEVVMPGYAALIGSLALATALRKRRVPFELAAMVGTLGVCAAALFHLSNILALPGVLWAVLARRGASRRDLAGAVVVSGITLVAVGAAAYLAARQIAPGVRSVAGFVHWVAARDIYPGWSEFRSDTLGRAASGFICSFQNFYTGLGWRDTLSGRLDWRMLPAQASMFIVVIMALMLPLAALKLRGRSWSGAPGMWGFLLLWFVPFAVFSAYQVAEDEEFWVTAAAPVLAAVSISLDALLSRRLLPLLPIILLFGNLSSPFIVWRSSAHLADVRAAEDVSRFIRPADGVVAPIWDWTEMMPVFARHDRFCVMRLADKKATRSSAIAGLREYCRSVEQRGGRLFMSSADSMSDAEWQWVEAVTKLPRSELVSRLGPRKWTSHGRSL